MNVSVLVFPQAGRGEEIRFWAGSGGVQEAKDEEKVKQEGI